MYIIKVLRKQSPIPRYLPVYIYFKGTVGRYGTRFFTSIFLSINFSWVLLKEPYSDFEFVPGLTSTRKSTVGKVRKSTWESYLG